MILFVVSKSQISHTYTCPFQLFRVFAFAWSDFFFFLPIRLFNRIEFDFSVINVASFLTRDITPLHKRVSLVHFADEFSFWCENWLDVEAFDFLLNLRGFALFSFRILLDIADSRNSPLDFKRNILHRLEFFTIFCFLDVGR
jgi:hypothetical protein